MTASVRWAAGLVAAVAMIGAARADDDAAAGPVAALDRAAELTRDKKQHAEAAARLERVLPELARERGADHPLVRRAWFWLGWARLGQGDHAAARRAFDRALDIPAAADDPLTGWAYLARALCEVRATEPKPALESLRRASETVARPIAPGFRSTFAVVTGRALHQSTRYEEAVGYYAEYTRLTAGDRGDPQGTYLAGQCEFALGRYAAARKLFEAAHAAREKHLGASHPRTCLALLRVGECRVEEKDLPAARAVADRVRRVVRNRPEGDGPGYAEVSSQLTELDLRIVLGGQSQSQSFRKPLPGGVDLPPFEFPDVFGPGLGKDPAGGGPATGTGGSSRK